jgi:hypothetical protein
VSEQKTTFAARREISKEWNDNPNGYGMFTDYVIARTIAAESTLARERESRKQAEAALQDVLEEYDGRQEDVMQMHYAYAIAKDAISKIRALSKPVQGPAERTTETNQETSHG